MSLREKLGITDSLIQAALEIRKQNIEEKKAAKLDPVGKEDSDVNNDGKSDKTDEYLANRRKAISSAIKNEEVENVDEKFETRRNTTAKMMAGNAPRPHGEPTKVPTELKKRPPTPAKPFDASEFKMKEEAESINERKLPSKAVVVGPLSYGTHTIIDLAADVDAKHPGTGEELEPGQKLTPDHLNALENGGHSIQQVAESAEINADNVAAARMHDCATHVFHHTHGLGECLYSMHAEPDENGYVSWYDVMFEHGIERVETPSFKVLTSEMHGNTHRKKKKKISEAQDDGVNTYPGTMQQPTGVSDQDEMEDDEEEEYDYEGEMAKSELMLTADRAIKISMMLKDNSQLEGWVQSKITKAADYISSVYNYMQYKGDSDEAGGDESQVVMNPEMKTEEAELVDEARGRPADEVTLMARKIQGHEKAHAAFKAAAKGKEIPATIIPDFRKRYGEKIKQVYNDHFGSKANDSGSSKPDVEETEHVVSQLGRVADNSGTKKVEVKHHISGETVSVEPRVAQHVLSKYQDMDKKAKEDYVGKKIISHLGDIQGKVDAKREELKKVSK